MHLRDEAEAEGEECTHCRSRCCQPIGVVPPPPLLGVGGRGRGRPVASQDFED